MDCRAVVPQALPHTTKLIREFVEDFAKLSAFYPHAPDFSSIVAVAKQLKFPDERRREVAGVLREQNVLHGSAAAAEENLRRLERGAVAVVTGQQVGLFGGPAFSFYKAMTAIATARQLTIQGIAAVPVFWMATEDHDVDEVRHTTWFRNGVLERLELPHSAQPALPVGRIVLGEAIRVIVELASETLAHGIDGPVLVRILRESYQPGATYGEAFGRLFARVFADEGLILLDPLDARLHRIAAPVLHQALQDRDALNDDLLKRGKELERAGYTAQVNVTSRSTLLFSMDSGARQVISAANGWKFTSGGRTAAREEWLKRVEVAPGLFSPNALLRPVVQDYLLPTVAYYGGPAEVAYFAQSQVLYERLLGRMPVILERADFTLVDPKGVRLLKKYGLAVEDVWHGKQELRRRMYGVSLPKKLARSFAVNLAQIEKSFANLHASIASVDPTVQGTIARAERRVKYQIEKLRQKAGQSRDRYDQVIGQQEAFLENLLYPQKGLQSRDLCFLPFLGRIGLCGLKDMENCAGKSAGKHLVVEIP